MGPRPNRVPYYQKYYQQAFKRHVRLWDIHPRSPYLLIPYKIMFWTSFTGTLWMIGRKVAGYNSMWGPK